MEPITEKDIPEMLDLLSAWQSTHAVMAISVRNSPQVMALNLSTVALLNRELR